jgi:hypothetical protein
MEPWLITTSAWPAATVRLAVVMARLLADPPVVVGVTTVAAVCAGVARRGSRAALRRRRTPSA